MPSFKTSIRKYRKYLIGFALAVAALLPIAAVDSYFEMSKNMEIYSDIYKELNIYYVDEVNPNLLMRTGIDAMLSSLDPYTNYYSEADMEGFRFQTTGKYGGIGAIIRKKGDFIAIMEPYQNSPAVKAGLIAGDLILEVDGKTVKDRSVEEVSAVLKGSPGSSVNLLVRRKGFERDQLFTIVREDVNIENVPYYGYLDEGIGYVRLSQFTNDATKNVKNAIETLKKEQEMKGLVLDLRGNPGGLLHEAVNLSNLFIDQGKMVVSTKGKVKEWNREFKTLNKSTYKDLPVVVLIDMNSASASEIVAGTLQDYDRGVILGKRTFGKGLVQQTRDIAYNTKLKLTTAKYYIPSGRSIQAIDYSIRNEDGSIGKIPDSLKTEFRTENGRTVYDGGGIEPDVEVEHPKLSNISLSLLTKDLIFDFATDYFFRNPTIPPTRQFEITEALYKDFVDFLADKDYDYETRSELLLRELETQTKEEKYFDAIRENMSSIKTNISHDKQNDLFKFKDEISHLLRTEIVSRYYYQSGEIESSFDDDPIIREAILVLKNPAKYNNLLKP
jgi:carboxyl-terminal processing protease